MAYTTVKDAISPSLYPLKSPHSMTPQFITIHNTANDASARNEIAYMKSNGSQTSYHVAIDDKEAIEAIPFNRNAWHSGDGNGDGNRKSIGIEICYSKSGGKRYTDSEANAIEYVAQMLKDRGWSIANVKWHRDWSGKNCPHRILDEGRAESVRKAITDRLAELTKPAEVKTASTSQQKEEIRMYKPSIKTLENEMVKTLEMAHENGLLSSADWAQKAKEGVLPLDDALGLMAAIIRRTNVENK